MSNGFGTGPGPITGASGPSPKAPEVLTKRESPVQAFENAYRHLFETADIANGLMNDIQGTTAPAEEAPQEGIRSVAELLADGPGVMLALSNNIREYLEEIRRTLL